ncbi:hypothetical protein ARMSODRAFT_973230 [Armillaria solidipes]|uniref:SET domain-containing protein n=1 Tax=Armillaria solidipes TaxID=1076256 RepID=A0A2H3BPN9_9AGAR|nr:hypothetical protein ARMSODRAFT_973230 [Armillaria solidipes]
MVHCLLNAANAHRRFFSTLPSSAREVNSNSRMELKSMITALTRMTPALAPLPDENDPGIFEHEPRPDDDVRTHVQVGDSQCLLTGYLKRRLEHIPGFLRPVKETRGAYHISLTLHRGMGMFAARRFKTGDLIADERPLMVFPMGPPTDLNEMMRSIFERMSEENQEAFMGLHNSRLQNGPLLGVARTNGYGLEDALKDETEIADLLSMMSSNNQVLKSMIGSCSPNIHRKFHMATFSMQLRAARDIEEGEEIFTYYTQILLTAADRAEGLAPYDARIDAAVQILAKIEEEELQASAPSLYHLFTAYALARDEKNALMYGEKLWLANLAASELLFRNAELLKKSPQCMLAELVAMPEWNAS